MPAARSLIFTLVVCFLATLSLASVIGPRVQPCTNERHQHHIQGGANRPSTEFSDLEPDMLHKLLHIYFPERYRHGIYQSDDQALEAVRADDAALATTLARLAKRQNSTVSPPTTSQPPPPPTTTAPPPPPPTTTSGPPVTGNSDTPTSSTPDPDPPTTQPPTPPLPTTTPPPPNPGTSSAPGRTTTAPPPTSPTVSFSPVRSTITSTLSNGDITIVTSTSYVAVNPTPAQSNTPQSSAGLQNAAVRPVEGSGTLAVSAALIAGVVGGLMAVW